MKAIFVNEHFNQPLILPIEEAENIFEVAGYMEDHSDLRERGICTYRKEIDNQPRFKGWVGPMFDGGMLRYETQNVYDMLSQ